MFEEYQSEVLRFYKEKASANELSLNLTHPTPAKLKAECVIVLRKRYLKKDDRLLKSFFELANEGEIYEQIIRHFDPDKFKPLDNFLKAKTAGTDEKNIELLAWLIDFQWRPYQGFRPGRMPKDESTGYHDTLKTPHEDVLSFLSKLTTTHEKDNVPILKKNILHDRPVTSEPIAESALTSTPFVKKAIIAFAILVATISGILFVADSKIGTYELSNFFLPRQEKCMYWDEDHYQLISCNRRPENALVLALDTLKLNHFKRITKQDTLTANSIGKIWYSKINNKVEFFTRAGFHPINIDRKLKPVTQRIIGIYAKQELK